MRAETVELAIEADDPVRPNMGIGGITPAMKLKMAE